jgi:hypothetical protein
MAWSYALCGTRFVSFDSIDLDAPVAATMLAQLWPFASMFTIAALRCASSERPL